MYPECEKLAAVSDERRAIVEFVEWAVGAGHLKIASAAPLDALVLEFFGVDRARLEAERRAMLDEARQGTP